MRHDLKTWPKFFDMVKRGVKPFEVRSNDRGFQECDTLLLQEYDPEAKAFTGNTLTCDVTCVVSGAEFGIKLGYVVMGIRVTRSRIANAPADRPAKAGERSGL
jgi:hypothetical protein